MTTLSITHRPAHLMIAAAAAVAALAAGSVAVSVAQDSGSPSAPGQQSHSSVEQGTARTHHFQPTTSGGHVMLGAD